MINIEKLIKDLTKASQLYYSVESPSITDEEFNKMLKELKE